MSLYAPYASIRDATDSMAQHRISCVVTKPVCTPVPPAAYGSVAGHAGFAPPAIALPQRATCFPAASGTITSHGANQTNVVIYLNLATNPCLNRATNPKHVLRPQFLRLRAKAGASRQAIIRSKVISASRGPVLSQPPPRGERSRFPRASATPWARLPSQPGPLPGANARCKRLIDSLASGTGVLLAHPARMIVSSRAQAGLPCSPASRVGQGVPAACFLKHIG